MGSTRCARTSGTRRTLRLGGLLCIGGVWRMGVERCTAHGCWAVRGAWGVCSALAARSTWAVHGTCAHSAWAVHGTCAPHCVWAVCGAWSRTVHERGVARGQCAHALLGGRVAADAPAGLQASTYQGARRHDGGRSHPRGLLARTHAGGRLLSSELHLTTLLNRSKSL
eukprot:275723-Chlamydomonas_euryale.AAC.1